MPPQQGSDHSSEQQQQDPATVAATTTSLAARSSLQVSQMVQHEMAIDHQPRGIRPSVLRRESFIVQFAKTKGPPQITLIMMLIAIGLGSTIGVVPAVMADRFARLNHGYDQAADCSSYAAFSDDKPAACFKGSADAQSAVALANLISNALTFITSSLIGSLSDEYGRKGILIVGLVMGMMSPFMLFLMQLLPHMSPWWYYGFHASTGLVNWVAVALSALADVLPQRFRAPGIGLLLAGFMLGFSLAPILAFFLSPVQLSFVSFSMVVLGLFLTIFVVPETLPPSVAAETKARRELEALRQEAADEEEDQEYYHHNHREQREDDDHDDNNQHYYYPYFTSNPSRLSDGQWWGWRWQQKLVRLLYSTRKFRRSAYRFILRPVKEMSILNRDTFFRLISLLAFFSGMVSSGDQVLLVYYLEERLGFVAQDVSIMFLIMGIMGLLSQGVLLKPLNDCLGERLVVAFCFLLGAVDNILYGLAQNKRTIFGAVALSALTGMAFPTISAIKANNVAVTEQGRIQGALYSLQALASGVGPVALRLVYSQCKDSALGPGAMFLFAAVFYLVAVAVALALPKDRANARVVEMTEEEDENDYNNSGGNVMRGEGEWRSSGAMDYHPLVSDDSESRSSDSSYGSVAQRN